MAQLKLPGMEALFGTHLGLVKASEEAQGDGIASTIRYCHTWAPEEQGGGEHRLVQKAS